LGASLIDGRLGKAAYVIATRSLQTIFKNVPDVIFGPRQNIEIQSTS
jgi:hypothetical protein